MLSFDGIAKNFRFIVVQVTKQIEHTLKLLERPDPRLLHTIRTSDDYVDTQKSMIENECFALLRRGPEVDDRTADTVRAVNVITNNLERIADFSVNIARQLQYLRDLAALGQFNHKAYFDVILGGLGQIVTALFERDSTLALQICRTEVELDRLYKNDFEQIVSGLRNSRDVENLITILLIVHYLERMGDALLNIGEAIIFAVMGERLKIHQYRVLEEALAATGDGEAALSDAAVGSIWGTRSGCRIGVVDERGPGAPRVIFKEGNAEKLLQERDSIERWRQLAPGLVPAVVEFQRRDEGAALLLEYLDGATFQDIVLNGGPPLIRRAQQQLHTTLRHIWGSTRRDGAVNAQYLRQLAARIDDVLRVHPALDETDKQLGRLHIHSFESLLQTGQALERQLDAPFSTFIHGDFNIDNIIYNSTADTLHFVDLHRSRDQDYVQDVSVMLVSTFRLPVFIPAIRRRLERVAQEFLGFARQFAAEQADPIFEARLALGLVRSFTTSMRFEFNRRFAAEMHQRATFLLHKLTTHPVGAWTSFRVPDEILRS